MFLQIQKHLCLLQNVLFVDDMEAPGLGVPLPTWGRRWWVDPALSTVARSFFLFLWMQLKSAFFFITQIYSTLILNRVTYILWSQFLMAWLAAILIQSGTKFMRKIQNHSKPALKLFVKSRLQVSSHPLIISYVYDPCATTGKIDMTCIVSNIQRLTHIFTSQQFK